MKLSVTKKQIWKEIKYHLIVWVFWYSINSLSLIYTWKGTAKLPMLYNYLSLVLLYYLICFSLKGHWSTVEDFFEQAWNSRDQFRYLFFRWQVLMILFLISAYVMVSWFIDRHLFHIVYDDFLLYCNGRWARASTYVFVAVGYSYFKYYSAKQKMKQKAADVKIIILKDYIARNHVGQVDTLNELIRRVDQVTGA